MRGRWVPAVALALVVLVALVIISRVTPEHAAAARRSGPGSTDGARSALNPDPAPLADDSAPPPLPGDSVIAPPPDQFDGPAATAAPPAALARGRFGNVVPSGGTWAVMIGINNYPGNGHDLRSAVADAADVNEALSRMGVPGDHRLLVTDGQAKASTVRLAADWLVAHAAPDAVAVFFYAGHVRKLSGTTEAVIAADGGTVTDADLAAHLRPLRATRSWIGIAACYGGGFTELLGPGRVLSAAAPADKLAYENAAFGRSYMVQFMVREAMIDERAPASVQDAFAYARDAIAHDYPGREPVQFDDGSGALTLRPPAAGPPPPARPGPTSSRSAPQSSGSPQPNTGSSNPGAGGGGASGGGSGGTSGQPANCQNVTLGVIRCS
ncbi:MAG: hypothetical protein QOI20_979 [Acidimicrobiaceae bacterium]|nr:hypothetical protein [Acidimicrobiaceae bacterium]